MTRRTKTGDEQLLKEYDAGEWVTVASAKAEIRKLRQAARGTLVKDQRINVRLSSELLNGIQARAAEEGLPYQTLIASILHKYVTGRLVEEHDFSTAKRAKDVPHLARLQPAGKGVRVGPRR
jgi:predicted DNA binding CopG/RHH family protein